MRPVGGLLGGMDDLARLLAVTLGPGAGAVISASGGGPEVLTDSATIARRVTALADTRRSAGAALLRDLVRAQGSRFGDGCATAAVLARSISAAALRAVVSGADPLLVRAGVHRATAAAAAAIRAQAVPVAGVDELAALLRSVTADPELAAVLAEAMDTVGADGGVLIEDYDGVTVERVYPDGARFRARPAGRETLYGANRQLTLVEPLIAVVHDELHTVAAIRALLEAALATGGDRPLLVIAPDVDGEALTTLRLNDRTGRLTGIAAALGTPRTRLGADLDDLALITGATVLSSERGRSPATAGPDDLGRCRWARLHSDHLTLAGPARRDPAYTRQLASLAASVDRLETAGEDAERTRRRLARLTGNLAVVRIGAHADTERKLRRSAADKAIRVARTALRSGTVPGGGVALLAAQGAVAEMLTDGAGRDERSGARAVLAGLDEVFLQLVGNGGRRTPRVVLDTLRGLGSGYGFDTTADDFVSLADWPVRDAAGVLAGAVEAAGSTAGLLAASAMIVPAVSAP